MGERFRLAPLGALVAVITAGCGSSEDPPPEVATAWERTNAWPHADVVPFDNVAVGAGADTLAWFTRRTRGETAGLAYREIRDGGDPLEIEVPSPGQGVVIPVAVATDDDGWAAVAVTRDAGPGENTGLMAWTGRPEENAPVAPGEMLPRLGEMAPPESVTVARSDDTTVVAAILGGEPLVWDTSNEAVAWEPSLPELGLEEDEDIVSLRVVGGDDRLVLAGVDAGGGTHLWTSTTGEDWQAVSDEVLPHDAGSVGLLAPLDDDRVALGWLDDEDTAPFNASSATIQVLDGEAIDDEGRITADGDAHDRIDVSGATVSPEGRLLVVGAGLRANGTIAPLLWARDGDAWEQTEQPELVGRLDYQFRAVTTTRDDTMVALITGLSSHIDVESWSWRPPDDG